MGQKKTRHRRFPQIHGKSKLTRHHTMKFTAEISDTETIFLDTVVTKTQHSTKNEPREKAIIDAKTHF